MAKIHVLSQDTINKIAAGEVIERPMAVAKELIENAIDAEASAVTVEIQDGGKRLIRITDNGCGMEEGDIELAFTPHATSKIQDVSDLLTVSSLGFRGEALASIASVSQLEMLTKTRESFMGYRYICEGGEKKELEAVGCPEGTTFLVRNLFYNTPARLKFLKTSQTEAGYISGLVERMALSHPEISFRFINQKQTRISTAGNGNLKDVIYHIYGRDIASNLIEVNQQEVFCEIRGFIGKPVVSRGNRGMMNYFINGRYIKSPVIQRAIEEAYAPYTMQHRYPFTVLHLTIDPQYIDVNVHPQKMEIRFHNEKDIFHSIYHGVSQGLKYREFIPEVTFQRKEEKEKKIFSSRQKAEPFEIKRRQGQDNLKALEKLSRDVPVEQPVQEKESFSQTIGVGGETSTKQEEDGAEKELTHVEGNVSETGQSDSKGNICETGLPCVDSHVAEKVLSVENSQLTERELPKGDSDGSIVRESGFFGVPKTGQENTDIVPKNVKQSTLFEEGILSDKARKETKIIGQVFSTYWILQYEDKMYMVDQHAAHEKVLYERFMKEIEKKEVITQLLHPPIVLSLSMHQQQAVEEHREILEKLGYQIEAFGGREYTVTGVPAHLPEVGSREMLLEVIDSLAEEQDRKKTPDILLEKVASMSCKAAVKGNNQLPVAQVEELLSELMTLENPYHCPHGRPTMISMSKTEIEKKFKRIV